MRQLKGNVKESAREKRERKKEFRENKDQGGGHNSRDFYGGKGS